MKTALFLGAAISLVVAQARAADVTAQPASGNGVVAKSNTGVSGRLRVQESGQISAPDNVAIATQTQALSEALARADAKFARAMRITHRFESEARAKGLAGNNWRAPLINRMMHATEAEFAPMELAHSLNDAMAAANLGARAVASTPPRTTPEVIGSAAFDLTYFPITPCRILDTRGHGGPLAADSKQSYSYDVVNPGASTTCSVFNQYVGAVIPAALAINVTVDESALSGFPIGSYLQIYPEGGRTPTSFINFGPGQIIANAGVVSENQVTGNFTVFTSAPAQVIIDVYGLFVEPRATPLNCTYTAQTNSTIPAGANFGTVSPSCPAGTTLAGGSCNTFANITLTSSSVYYGSSWICYYYNNSASSTNVYASANCCSIPGQ